ncbi:MAG: cytochrome c biogenesis protein ResB [Nitrospirae bacterium]|nr:cytochrome c biogenesis protein ResB [Nitrospirota bacterium]
MSFDIIILITKLINTLSSIRLFFTLSALMLAAFLIGGVIPQGESPEAYQEMFGRIGGDWIMNLRLNNIFSSFWFLALMACGSLNILACTIKQWKALKLRPGIFLSHLGVMMMFMGGAVHGLFAVRGTLALEAGQTRGEFAGDDGTQKAMPFNVLLKNFQIRYWEQEKHIIYALKKWEGSGHDGEDLLESVQVEPGKVAHFKSVAADLTVIKFYPNFSIGDSGPVTMDESRQNPALAVKLTDSKTAKPSYLFANYPDFHGVQDMAGIRYVYEYNPGRIKQFESRIAVLEDGVEKMEKVISVNSPAGYKGYRFYQSGYDPKNPNFSSIQVAKDPSVAFIYAGFAVLMIGLTWALWKEMK